MTPEAIALMEERFVTREELCALLGTNDRQARKAIELFRRSHPVISTSGRKGYKIANSEEDVKLAKQALKELRNKALTTLKDYKQLKAFIESFEAINDPQLKIEF